MPTDGPALIGGLAEISDQYDALYCDVWGCYHNGVRPYPAAVAALAAYRRAGGVVLLLTNAPRPDAAVRRQLDAMAAPEDSYDAVVSSGDATRAALAGGDFGRRLHVVGPSRDDGLWSGLDLELTTLEQAEAILCTGLFDDSLETPADYADLIAEGVARGLAMLCANPDLVVDRGERRVYCAGAIAQAYAQAGGVARLFGKPHAPIYARAFEVACALRPGLDPERILAIGDGLGTDVLGASQAGLDCLFVSGGLAASEIGGAPERPDRAALAHYLASKGATPRYAIGRLG